MNLYWIYNDICIYCLIYFRCISNVINTFICLINQHLEIFTFRWFEKKILKGHNLTKTEINDFEYHKPHKSVRKGYLQTSSSWACSFGCNITSILFGIGKWEPVKKIHQYEFHKNTRFIKRRTNSRRSSEIRITGTCNVLSWKEGRKVNEFRGKVATSSSCVQVQTYSHQHRMPQSNILRVYYQAQVWMGSDGLHPAYLGWQLTPRKFAIWMSKNCQKTWHFFQNNCQKFSFCLRKNDNFWQY